MPIRGTNRRSTTATTPALRSTTGTTRGTTTPRTTTPRRPGTGTVDAFTTRAVAIPKSKGMLKLADRAAFEAMARRDDVPGAAGAREVKFLMTGVDTGNPQLYFINSKNIAYHWDFATQALGMPLSNAEFNAQTYFRDSRKNLAGTLVAHDSFAGPGGKKGMYALEFWPTDPVKANHVAMAFKEIEKQMPFARGQLAYHPAGNTQEALFKRESAELKRLGVKSIDTSTLFKNQTFSALNQGEGYGVLRVIDPSQPGNRPPTVRDVVIFKSLPNDLSHVGGVISEAPQTSLSHINLKAKQNDTPNAYLKDAANDPKVKPFIGKLVHYKVGPDGVEIKEATQAQADAWLNKMRPTRTQVPPRDLSLTSIVSLDRLGQADARRVGAKAANLAELRKVLPNNTSPGGSAIPFSFYDKFMKANGLDVAAKAMMADPRFKSDPAVREQMLEDFRRRIRRADLPAELATKIAAAQKTFPAGQPIRARSSTNNEDMEGFNGAGLYDSYTHRADEGHLGETVKQVWASLWNFRAFEEREFHRIDHMGAAMAVLLTRNYDDEKANGVAVTKNVYDPNWPGLYVNVQVGESLVTNPDPSATPDELLLSRIGEHGEWETQYIRDSSLTQSGKHVLTEAQLRELTAALNKIQDHFKATYGKQNDPKFAMDVEFKIDLAGKLIVKQARPWVD
jgi:pyruvate, water dikinase